MLFSIIIPTFQNHRYLRMTLESILKNSQFKHQIIVHINGDDINTRVYLDENNIEYTISKNNLGLCKGVNKAASLAKTDYITYSHDDMYFLPQWDSFIYNEIKKLKDNLFFLSGTQIGPLTNNVKKPNHIFFNAGSSLDNFNEALLLKKYKNLKFHDLQGSHWAPHVIHKKIWHKIGGFSEEFDPGFGSDPDLNMKLWNEGVRIFKGVNLARTYHFGSITTRKNINVLKNNANTTFLLKWGISIDFFTKNYLNRGDVFLSPLNDFKLTLKNLLPFLICKIKYFYLSVTNIYKNEKKQ